MSRGHDHDYSANFANTKDNPFSSTCWNPTTEYHGLTKAQYLQWAMGDSSPLLSSKGFESSPDSGYASFRGLDSSFPDVRVPLSISSANEADITSRGYSRSDSAFSTFNDVADEHDDNHGLPVTQFTMDGLSPDPKDEAFSRSSVSSTMSNSRRESDSGSFKSNSSP